MVTVEEIQEKVGRFARNWSRCSSVLYVSALYVVATGVGCSVSYAVDEYTTASEINEYPLLLAAIADVAATIVVWLGAIIINNSSMYDPYWSVFPPFVTIYWLLVAESDAKDVPILRTVLVFVSVWVWGIRLTTNWLRDWPGVHHEDFRYILINHTTSNVIGKIGYWLTGSLFGIMMFPTLLVFLGCTPIYYALYTGVADDEASSVNALDYIATIIAVTAAILQFVADEQMRTFRKSKPPAGSCMESGLWRYSRHPNYFGELQFWFGCYVHALAVNLQLWWTGLGFLLMVILFVFVSVPLMEKRSLKRRPNYIYTIRSTSMLIPLPRFGRGNSVSQGDGANVENLI